MAKDGETHGVEEYLEAVYELQEEGVRVLQARIAERLGVSRATVSEQVKRLARRGLVAMEDRAVRLTAHGATVAEDAVRRHRMAERFLVEVLKLPWHRAHEAANEFQSGITGEIERRMTALLGRPATCPHGNPIPGSGHKPPKDLRPLVEFQAGASVELVRLTEDVELDTRRLEYFEDHGLMPGAHVDVTSVAPDGTMTLRVGRKRSSLGPALADNLWVRPRGNGSRGRR